MRIWNIVPDTKREYTQIIPTNDFFDNKDLEHFWFYEIGDKETPISFKTIEVKKQYKSKKMFNIHCFFDRVILVDKKTIEVLASFVNNSNVEIFPIKFEGQELYVLNSFNRYNAEEVLDMNQSEFIRFKSSGKIMFIKKFKFIKSRIDNKHIFYIEGVPVCDDCFKDTVIKNNLTGISFKLLWDSGESIL